jgi:hypothetical protein
MIFVEGKYFGKFSKKNKKYYREPNTVVEDDGFEE